MFGSHVDSAAYAVSLDKRTTDYDKRDKKGKISTKLICVHC